MAKFKAKPYYSVHYKDGNNIRFDQNGFYETDDAGEIEVLKALCPRYISLVDEGKKVTKAEESEAPKKANARKASAK